MTPRVLKPLASAARSNDTLPMFTRLPCPNPLRWLAPLLILLVSIGFSRAANDASWFARTWQTDEGLPDNAVTGIAQTPDGFLWVATQG